MKLFRLTRVEQRLVVCAAFAVIRAWLALRLFPGRVLRRLNRPSEGPLSPIRSSPEQIAWAVRGVSRYVPRATCLVRALAAQALLTRAGYSTLVRIGLRRDDHAALRGHAWVESADQVILGDCPELTDYVDMVGKAHA